MGVFIGRPNGGTARTPITGVPTLAINGVGVDPSIIQPVRLELWGDGRVDQLTLKIHRAFDEIDGLDFVNEVEMIANSEVVFRGVLTTRGFDFSVDSDGMNITVPGIAWKVDSDYVERDFNVISPGEMLNTIFDGRTVINGEVSLPKIDSDDMVLGSDGAILGDAYLSFNLQGLGAYQAITEVVRRSGNFISWVSYDSDRAYFNFIERGTGESRKVYLGDSGDVASAKANVVSITGSQDASQVRNRVIVRGDRKMLETTTKNPLGDSFDITPAWDSSLQSGVLAPPFLGLIDAEAAIAHYPVGRRFKINIAAESGGMLLSLLSSTGFGKGSSGATALSQQAQLFEREAGISGAWRPSTAAFHIEREPLAGRRTLGGENVDNEGGLYLVFRDMQFYKSSLDSGNDNLTAVREFKLTLALRDMSVREDRGMGRVTADSGKVGDFELERKSLVVDSSLKLMRLKSERYAFNSGGTYTGISNINQLVQDDRGRARNIANEYAKRGSNPETRFQIVIQGPTAPDFSFSQGQIIVSVENSEDFEDVDWNIVGVAHTFDPISTILYTDDVLAFRSLPL